MRSFEFCLPTKGTLVPAGPDWLHEVKYDGYRLRLERGGDRAVRGSFQKNIDEHFHANVTFAEGAVDTVTARAEINSDAFRSRGIEKCTTSYTVQLRGGKIARWSSPLPPQTPAKKN